jgi:hypothetical protein
VRLAWPCLPIGKEACVITVPSIIEHILSELYKVRGNRNLPLRTRTSSHDTLDLRALDSRHRELCTRHTTRNCSQKWNPWFPLDRWTPESWDRSIPLPCSHLAYHFDT